MRLMAKLQLAFVAVIVIGVAIVSLLANQAAEREVRAYMFGSGMTTASQLAQDLADFYAEQGSWNGVADLLASGNVHHRAGMGMDQRLTLIDPQGLIIADSSSAAAGAPYTAPAIATAVEVQHNGQTLATLWVEGGMTMGPGSGSFNDATELLARVNRAIWLAALAAGAIGLALGALFSYGLTRPLQRLMAATRAIASGDFSHRVGLRSQDEIGALAASLDTMAAALQDAERQRRSLTADIAHELRNPLAVLQGNLEALSDGVLPPTPDNLQPLIDQSRLLARIVDDLRTLSLAESGQLSLERAVVAPQALAQAVAARFAAQAAARDITLSVNAADTLPAVTVDAQRIEQVLGNLLSNALRHTPEGGRVTCRVERGAGEPADVVFSVADSGPGIPSEALPSVFDRFYRIDRGRARADGGTGLGLAIAKQFVIAHGGSITAANLAQGGAVVSFTVPLSPPDSPHRDRDASA